MCMGGSQGNMKIAAANEARSLDYYRAVWESQVTFVVTYIIKQNPPKCPGSDLNI